MGPEYPIGVSRISRNRPETAQGAFAQCTAPAHAASGGFVRIIQLQPGDLLNARGARSEDSMCSRFTGSRGSDWTCRACGSARFRPSNGLEVDLERHDATA